MQTWVSSWLVFWVKNQCFFAAIWAPKRHSPETTTRGVFESNKGVPRDERHFQPGHQPCLTAGTPPSTPGSATGKFTRYSQATCWVLPLLMQK